jgi:hypothetical protein
MKPFAVVLGLEAGQSAFVQRELVAEDNPDCLRCYGEKVGAVGGVGFGGGWVVAAACCVEVRFRCISFIHRPIEPGFS